MPLASALRLWLPSVATARLVPHQRARSALAGRKDQTAAGLSTRSGSHRPQLALATQLADILPPLQATEGDRRGVTARRQLETVMALCEGGAGVAVAGAPGAQPVQAFAFGATAAALSAVLRLARFRADRIRQSRLRSNRPLSDSSGISAAGVMELVAADFTDSAVRQILEHHAEHTGMLLRYADLSKPAESWLGAHTAMVFSAAVGWT